MTADAPAAYTLHQSILAWLLVGLGALVWWLWYRRQSRTFRAARAEQAAQEAEAEAVGMALAAVLLIVASLNQAGIPLDPELRRVADALAEAVERAR